MAQYDYAMERMKRKRASCRHREIVPILKIKRNWPYGRNSEPLEVVRGIRYYECKWCGTQFEDEDGSYPRKVKVVKKDEKRKVN